MREDTGAAAPCSTLMQPARSHGTNAPKKRRTRRITRRSGRRDQNAAANAIDQHLVDGAAPPAQRKRFAAGMPEDEEIDTELFDEARDHVDGLADHQMRLHIEPERLQSSFGITN